MKKLLSVFFVISTFLFSAFSQNIGLVLSGGGAKGAYEVGVWKALYKSDLTDKIKVISGTSVGALNAALFACTTPAKTEKLWLTEVGYETFLMPDAESIQDLADAVVNDVLTGIEKSENSFNQENQTDNKFLNSLKSFASKTGNATVELGKHFIKSITDYCLGDKHTEGLFTRDSLENLLGRTITVEKIKKSKYSVYATTIRKRYLLAKGLAELFIDIDSSHSFLLNEQISDTTAREILLASSALPIVYNSQKISADAIENGMKVNTAYEYIDGGFTQVGGQNTPYKPVLANPKIDTVIVVYLKSENELAEKDGIRPELITPQELGNRKLIEIIPSVDLGNLITGTVNFDGKKIEELIELGYNDAAKIIEQYLENKL